MDLQIEKLDEIDAPLSFWEGVGVVCGAIVVGGAIGVGIGIAVT